MAVFTLSLLLSRANALLCPFISDQSRLRWIGCNVSVFVLDFSRESVCFSPHRTLLIAMIQRRLNVAATRGPIALYSVYLHKVTACVFLCGASKSSHSNKKRTATYSFAGIMEWKNIERVRFFLSFIIEWVALRCDTYIGVQQRAYLHVDMMNVKQRH